MIKMDKETKKLVHNKYWGHLSYELNPNMDPMEDVSINEADIYFDWFERQPVKETIRQAKRLVNDKLFRKGATWNEEKQMWESSRIERYYKK